MRYQTKCNREEVTLFAQQGKTLEWIAGHFGVSRQRIGQLVDTGVTTEARKIEGIKLVRMLTDNPDMVFHISDLEYKRLRSCLRFATGFTVHRRQKYRNVHLVWAEATQDRTACIIAGRMKGRM